MNLKIYIIVYARVISEINKINLTELQKSLFLKGIYTKPFQIKDHLKFRWLYLKPAFCEYLVCPNRTGHNGQGKMYEFSSIGKEFCRH